VEDAEDDGAGDAEDKHQESLTEEPLAHLLVCSLKGMVEAAALHEREEGEEEAIGVFAFEHEIDTEEDSGENVEDVREPEGQRGNEVAGGGCDGSLGALGDGFDAEAVGHGKPVDPGGEVGDADREFGGELAEVAQDGGKADGEEDRQDEGDTEDEKKDGRGAGDAAAADVRGGDAADDGHQDGGEEGTDVDDQQLLLQGPGEGEEEEDAEAEEDVAANVAARLLFTGREVGRRGGQRILLCRELDAASVRRGRSGAGVRRLVQAGEDGCDCFVRGKGGGVDGEAGEAGVEGVAAGETELGCGGVFEEGAADVLQHAAIEEGGEGGVEEDSEGGRGLLEEETVGEVLGGSAAEGEDGVGLAEGGGEGGGLEAAEAGFAVALEELGDCGSGALLEVSVEVEEVPAELGREKTADGGFAGSHEAGEDETFKVCGNKDGGGVGLLGQGIG